MYMCKHGTVLYNCVHTFTPEGGGPSGAAQRCARYEIGQGLKTSTVFVKLYWPSGAVRGLRSFIIAGSYYIIMSTYVTCDISRPDRRGAYVAGAVRY